VEVVSPIKLTNYQHSTCEDALVITQKQQFGSHTHQ